MNKLSLSLSLIALSLAASSCKQSTTESVTTKAETTVEAKKYELVAFKPSTAYADATINGYTYKKGIFDFDVSGTDYKLGEQTPDAPQKMCANSAKGQHIHLIVDKAPYAAKYTSTFDHEVADGEHHLLAFLSRSYHESIKTTQASTMQKVTVEDGSITSAADITEPVLFYSRPKGTYVGKDTEKVMLDFYIGNTTLGDNKVVANINGEEHLLDKWQPYYIKGLPMGENTVTLTLVDGEGNPIASPLNPVSRTFTLKAEPITEG